MKLRLVKKTKKKTKSKMENLKLNKVKVFNNLVRDLRSFPILQLILSSNKNQKNLQITKMSKNGMKKFSNGRMWKLNSTKKSFLR